MPESLSIQSGNAYGTTWIGGANNAGVVFRLIPKPSGPWDEKSPL